MFISLLSGICEVKVNGNIVLWYKFIIKNYLNVLKIFLKFNLLNIIGIYLKICFED